MACHTCVAVLGGGVDSDGSERGVLADQELGVNLVSTLQLATMAHRKESCKLCLEFTSKRVALLIDLTVVVSVRSRTTVWDARVATIETSDAAL